MNIVAAQRQYRWPKANIVFADRQKYRSPNSLLKKQSRHWETSSQCPPKLISTYIQPPPFMPTGMNIVAAQRQYRWPQANIVFAAGKNIVPQSPLPKNKPGIGKP
ncbi:MAG: hypothetical protein IKJ29_05695, partial [Akkermansia sp.]|nr:hypothetical protein [Akkermansia sp.]